MSSLLDFIGNTPLVQIIKLINKPKVNVLVKLEGNNPGGSVKDRAAYSMIKGAIDRAELKPGMKLIEATSGNTGIALAMIASLFGYEIEVVMPDNATLERILTMEAYGAKVTLTPQEKSMEGAIDYVNAKVVEGGYFVPNQFSNPDNYLAHYKTTGPELWRDTDGKITHFVSSMGTTGTIMGVSMYLKEKKPDVQIIGVQPMDGANIPGIRRWPEEYLPKIYNPARVDRIIDVTQDQATETTRKLAKAEGIFAGMSSGGALFAALKIAHEIEEGTIVAIICDRGDRYLSSDLFKTKI